MMENRIDFTEFLEEKTEELEEEFKVDNDKKADWAIRKIKETRDEYKRIDEILEQQEFEIKQRRKALKESSDVKESYFIGLLQTYEYDYDLSFKETKTQRTYKLASGNIVIKKAIETFDNNNTEIIKSIKENEEYKEFVKYEPKLSWAELKKKLAIIDGNIINKETGEIVEIEGLRLKKTHETFDIKINK